MKYADLLLLTFSKCGDDGFVKTGMKNWKKCPGLLDSHENSHFTKSVSKKSVLTSVKHQSIYTLTNKCALSRLKGEMG